MQILTIIPAFLIALGVLVAVHEYGHYKVAKLCGVKVLRFSLGIGKIIFRRQGKETEFVLSVLPLGGYVKMLDEREGDVKKNELNLAFNRKPLFQRFLIVLAGPVANLILAIVLYAFLSLIGNEEPRAILSSPNPESLIGKAGISGGELVTKIKKNDSAEFIEVKSFVDLQWNLMVASLNSQDLSLELSDGRRIFLPISQLEKVDNNQGLFFENVGINRPFSPAKIVSIMENSPALKAGIQAEDLILKAENQQIIDAESLLRYLKSSEGKEEKWLIERNNLIQNIYIKPEISETGGKIGVYLGKPPELVLVRSSFWDSFVKGFNKTYEISALSLKTLGRIITGSASVKNLSGPVTVADVSGKAANQGLRSYLSLLALLSVSLGILNLLPLPVLDGGHLMFYLWEAITKKEVSELWSERFQKFGVACLILLMSVAFYNDIERLIVRYF